LGCTSHTGGVGIESTLTTACGTFFPISFISLLSLLSFGRERYSQVHLRLLLGASFSETKQNSISLVFPGGTTSKTTVSFAAYFSDLQLFVPSLIQRDAPSGIVSQKEYTDNETVFVEGCSVLIQRAFSKTVL